jgi:crossover junction endodeoxyribonuclease RuvC
LIILGIDPGLASTGYGAIVQQGTSHRLVEVGTIRTSPAQALPQRLQFIHESLVEVIQRLQPQIVAVEELFFANNAVSVMGVAQARGVAILAASQPTVRITEFTPLQVKQAVTGSGRADKSQVHRMVEILLGLKARSESSRSGKSRSLPEAGEGGGTPGAPDPRLTPTTTHESDALALALCQAHSGRMAELQAANVPKATSLAEQIARASRKRRRH